MNLRLMAEKIFLLTAGSCVQARQHEITTGFLEEREKLTWNGQGKYQERRYAR